MTLRDTPADVVAGLSLAAGVVYALQAQGAHPALLHFGGANAPSPTPAPPLLILVESESFPVEVSEENIWGWTYGGQTTRLTATRMPMSLGPPRAIEAVDVSSGDYVRERGFVLQVNAAGDVAYTPMDGGSTSRTETFSAAGFVGVAGVPVALRAVHRSGTTTGLSLTAGLL